MLTKVEQLTMELTEEMMTRLVLERLLFSLFGERYDKLTIAMAQRMRPGCEALLNKEL